MNKLTSSNQNNWLLGHIAISLKTCIPSSSILLKVLSIEPVEVVDERPTSHVSA